MTGVPDWALEASRPGPLRLLDVVLEVCHAFGWTTEQALDVPVRRFWLICDWLKRRNQERAQAARQNPLGALAVSDGR